MSNKTYNPQTRIKKFITGIIALSLFYLISCGSEGGSSPSGNIVGGSDAIKALTLKEVDENSVTVSWELLRTEEGDVDGSIAYTVYAETNDGDSGRVFTKDVTTETDKYTTSGATSGEVTVTDLVKDTPYRIVVEAMDTLGNIKKSGLLVYTDSISLAGAVNWVKEPEIGGDQATVTWYVKEGARGYALHAIDKQNLLGEDDSMKNIYRVICPPDSLLCDGDSTDGFATKDGVNELRYTFPIKEGIRYEVAIISFNFRDLTGLQATDEQGSAKTFTEAVLVRVTNETTSGNPLRKRLQDDLEDADTREAYIPVTKADPPKNLVLESTGSTVTARWEHGDGAEHYYASIRSNGGVNAVTNIVDRYTNSQATEEGLTIFTNLTAETPYTVIVESFTVIDNVTNLGGSLSRTVTTSNATVVLERAARVAAQHLTLTNHEPGKLRVVWDTPESNSVTGYNVVYWTDDPDKQEVEEVGKGKTNVVISDLEPGNYNVRVDVRSTYGGQELVTGDTKSILIYTTPFAPRDLEVDFFQGRFTNIGDKLYTIGYPLTYTEVKGTLTEAGGPVGDVSYLYRYRVSGVWVPYAEAMNGVMVDLQVDDWSDVAMIQAGYGDQYLVEVIASNAGGFVSEPETLVFVYQSFPEPFNHSELTVTSSNRSLIATWPAVTEVNGSIVASYTVLLNDDPYRSPLQVASALSLDREVVFKGLENNQPYYLTVIPNGAATTNLLHALSRVTGYTYGGTLTAGSEAERILTNYTGVPMPHTPQGYPEKVEKLEVTSGKDQATVTWEEPATGSPATGYVLEYLKGVTSSLNYINQIGDDADKELSLLTWEGFTNVPVPINSTGKYSNVVSGLDVTSATNVFRVRAVHDDGSREWPGAYRYYALGTDPSRAPDLVEALIFSNHQLSGSFTVAWNKPSPGKDKDGKTATLEGYKVSWGLDAQTDEGEHEINDPDTLFYEITGLTPGTQYHIRVQAKNNNPPGNYDYNGGTTGTTYAIKAPESVASITYSGHATNKFTVSWDAVDAGRGSDGTASVGYLVHWSNQASGWQSVTRSDYSTTSQAITGLTSGTEYWVKVTATNSFSSASPTEGGGTWTYSLPGKVSDLTVRTPSYDQATHAGGFTVAWTAPADTGISSSSGAAATITGYQVSYLREGDASGIYTSVDGNIVSPEYAFTGLKTNAKYDIRIQAKTGAGTGPVTNISGWTPSLPGAVDPDSITFSEQFINTIKIQWDAPQEGRAGGPSPTNATTRYKVEIGPDGGSYTEVTADHQDTSITATGLNHSTTYRARITARNHLGDTAPSVSTATGETLVGIPPSKVTNLQVVTSNVTESQVMLSWEPPIDVGADGDGSTAGVSISTYVVKYKKTADNDFNEINDKSGEVRLTAALTGTSTNATVTGLQASTSYTFLVAAVNSANAVTSDVDASNVEQVTGPAIPGNLRKKAEICAKTTEVDLVWDASPGAASYKVYRDGSEIISVTSTSYTDSSLTAGTTYEYTVRACSADGVCSSDSNLRKIATDGGNNFKSIIQAKKVPADLDGYDERSKEIFSRYQSNATLQIQYFHPNGQVTAGHPSTSFDRFESYSDLHGKIATITDASATKVYVLLMTAGKYGFYRVASMENHIAIIGGVNECLEFSDQATVLDGGGSDRVFNNNEGLDDTALLYRVTITGGNAGSSSGGGVHNDNSSPSLVEVTFSGNSASFGGGMYNENNSSPSLIRVTFSGNAASQGGGMYNNNSSPNLVGVTFSGNTANFGGGMRNNNSSPNLVGVTFSGNSANFGGGIYNDKSAPNLDGVTFSGNTADDGGGVYNKDSSPNLDGVTFSGNTATNHGGGIYNDSADVDLVGTTFSGNTADKGGAIYNSSYNNLDIINSIFWGNNNNSGKQIVVGPGTMEIFSSIVEGGTGTMASGANHTNLNDGKTNGGGFDVDGELVNYFTIRFEDISDQDPGLLPLADNSGPVWTHAIPGNSGAVNQGLYVRRKWSAEIRKDIFYYSTNNSDWYNYYDNMALLYKQPATLPGDEEDITATDATGYIREQKDGRPDLGAYEFR